MTIRKRHESEQSELRTNERSRDRAQLTIDMVFNPIQQTRLSKYGI